MTLLEVKTEKSIPETVPIHLNNEAASVPTPREVYQALLDKAHAEALDAASPNRIKALSNITFYNQMLQEPSTDEMRASMSSRQMRSLAKTSLKR